MMIITFLSVLTALLVVTSTSTVYSVLWLVGTFLIISALLGFLNLGFTALLYIIVYVGAIAILFLFVVQLLDLGSVSEQPTVQEFNNNKSEYLLTSSVNSTANSSKGITPLAIVISLALLTIIIVAGFSSSASWGAAQIISTDSLELGTSNTNSLTTNLQSLFYNGSNVDISSLLATKVVDANSTLLSTTTIVSSVQGGTPQVQSIAEWFYGPGLLPLVIISIILLVAMIAPISLCKDND